MDENYNEAVGEEAEVLADAATEAATSGNEGGDSTEELEEQQRLEEQAARARGWKPKDKYTKDPATFVDARTFLRRGEL